MGLIEVLQILINLANQFLVLLVGFALLGFLIGVFKYFTTSPDQRKESKNYMMYGLISLFVITSLWGLIRVMAITFDINLGGSTPTYEEVRNQNRYGFDPTDNSLAPDAANDAIESNLNSDIAEQQGLGDDFLDGIILEGDDLEPIPDFEDGVE